jgi:hypothetical protein
MGIAYWLELIHHLTFRAYMYPRKRNDFDATRPFNVGDKELLLVRATPKINRVWSGCIFFYTRPTYSLMHFAYTNYMKYTQEK